VQLVQLVLQDLQDLLDQLEQQGLMELVVRVVLREISKIMCQLLGMVLEEELHQLAVLVALVVPVLTAALVATADHH
jgi:hypothetical protein